MSKKHRLNLMEELTTYKCDYQIWPLDHVQHTPVFSPREETAKKPPPPNFRIDIQSHAICNPDVHIPFDLYLEPKPIVKTDPRACFELKKLSKYPGRKVKQFRSTILPPALPIDELEDDGDINKILKFMYTGNQKMLMDEAALKTSKRPDPPNRVVTENQNIKFKPVLYAPLPSNWIAAAKHWDCLQGRILGDPTGNFWRRRGPHIECSCCCNSLPSMLSKEMKEKIQNCIYEDNLSLPYDVTKTGYGGYRQICAKGVPLEKNRM